MSSTKDFTTNRQDSFHFHLKGLLKYYISDRARLLNLLLERGMSEVQIAKELKVSREAVNNWKVIPYED